MDSLELVFTVCKGFKVVPDNEGQLALEITFVPFFELPSDDQDQLFNVWVLFGKFDDLFANGARGSNQGDSNLLTWLTNTLHHLLSFYQSTKYDLFIFKRKLHVRSH